MEARIDAPILVALARAGAPGETRLAYQFSWDDVPTYADFTVTGLSYPTAYA